ncbi:hypothetical protein SOVF_202970 [Spinacia oleracea]|nr:hypothetical protein SOVF_202970 [Spinacia oleracea]
MWVIIISNSREVKIDKHLSQAFVVYLARAGWESTVASLGFGVTCLTTGLVVIVFQTPPTAAGAGAEVGTHFTTRNLSSSCFRHK